MEELKRQLITANMSLEKKMKSVNNKRLRWRIQKAINELHIIWNKIKVSPGIVNDKSMLNLLKNNINNINTSTLDYVNNVERKAKEFNTDKYKIAYEEFEKAKNPKIVDMPQYVYIESEEDRRLRLHRSKMVEKFTEELKTFSKNFDDLKSEIESAINDMENAASFDDFNDLNNDIFMNEGSVYLILNDLNYLKNYIVLEFNKGKYDDVANYIRKEVENKKNILIGLIDNEINQIERKWDDIKKDWVLRENGYTLINKAINNAKDELNDKLKDDEVNEEDKTLYKINEEFKNILSSSELNDYYNNSPAGNVYSDTSIALGEVLKVFHDDTQTGYYDKTPWSDNFKKLRDSIKDDNKDWDIPTYIKEKKDSINVMYEEHLVFLTDIETNEVFPNLNKLNKIHDSYKSKFTDNTIKDILSYAYDSISNNFILYDDSKQVKSFLEEANELLSDYNKILDDLNDSQNIGDDDEKYKANIVYHQVKQYADIYNLSGKITDFTDNLKTKYENFYKLITEFYVWFNNNNLNITNMKDEKILKLIYDEFESAFKGKNIDDIINDNVDITSEISDDFYKKIFNEVLQWLKYCYNFMSDEFFNSARNKFINDSGINICDDLNKLDKKIRESYKTVYNNEAMVLVNLVKDHVNILFNLKTLQNEIDVLNDIKVIEIDTKHDDDIKKVEDSFEKLKSNIKKVDDFMLHQYIKNYKNYYNVVYNVGNGTTHNNILGKHFYNEYFTKIISNIGSETKIEDIYKIEEQMENLDKNYKEIIEEYYKTLPDVLAKSFDDDKDNVSSYFSSYNNVKIIINLTLYKNPTWSKTYKDVIDKVRNRIDYLYNDKNIDTEELYIYNYYYDFATDIKDNSSPYRVVNSFNKKIKGINKKINTEVKNIANENVKSLVENKINNTRLNNLSNILKEDINNYIESLNLPEDYQNYVKSLKIIDTRVRSFHENFDNFYNSLLSKNYKFTIDVLKEKIKVSAYDSNNTNLKMSDILSGKFINKIFNYYEYATNNKFNYYKKTKEFKKDEDNFNKAINKNSFNEANIKGELIKKRDDLYNIIIKEKIENDLNNVNEKIYDEITMYVEDIYSYFSDNTNFVYFNDYVVNQKPVLYANLKNVINNYNKVKGDIYKVLEEVEKFKVYTKKEDKDLNKNIDKAVNIESFMDNKLNEHKENIINFIKNIKDFKYHDDHLNQVEKIIKSNDNLFLLNRKLDFLEDLVKNGKVSKELYEKFNGYICILYRLVDIYKKNYVIHDVRGAGDCLFEALLCYNDWIDTETKEGDVVDPPYSISTTDTLKEENKECKESYIKAKNQNSQCRENIKKFTDKLIAFKNTSDIDDDFFNNQILYSFRVKIENKKEYLLNDIDSLWEIYKKNLINYPDDLPFGYNEFVIPASFILNKNILLLSPGDRYLGIKELSQRRLIKNQQSLGLNADSKLSEYVSNTEQYIKGSTLLKLKDNNNIYINLFNDLVKFPNTKDIIILRIPDPDALHFVILIPRENQYIRDQGYTEITENLYNGGNSKNNYLDNFNSLPKISVDPIPASIAGGIGFLNSIGKLFNVQALLIIIIMVVSFYILYCINDNMNRKAFHQYDIISQNEKYLKCDENLENLENVENLENLENVRYIKNNENDEKIDIINLKIKNDEPTNNLKNIRNININYSDSILNEYQ